jgi:hypothetical protein
VIGFQPIWWSGALFNAASRDTFSFCHPDRGLEPERRDLLFSVQPLPLLVARILKNPTQAKAGVGEAQIPRPVGNARNFSPLPRLFAKSTLEFPYRFIFLLRHETVREKDDER